jgi:hypothetical protein
MSSSLVWEGGFVIFCRREDELGYPCSSFSFLLFLLVSFSLLFGVSWLNFALLINTLLLALLVSPLRSVAVATFYLRYHANCGNGRRSRPMVIRIGDEMFGFLYLERKEQVFLPSFSFRLRRSPCSFGCPFLNFASLTFTLLSTWLFSHDFVGIIYKQLNLNYHYEFDHKE